MFLDPTNRNEGIKTGVPGPLKPERGHNKPNDGTKKKPERGHIRQNPLVTKPCFPLGKQARFTLNVCSGMPLRKVHELTFLWFGLPGPLLTETGTRAQQSERRYKKPERGHIRQNPLVAKPPFCFLSGVSTQGAHCQRPQEIVRGFQGSNIKNATQRTPPY